MAVVCCCSVVVQCVKLWCVCALAEELQGFVTTAHKYVAVCCSVLMCVAVCSVRALVEEVQEQAATGRTFQECVAVCYIV